MRLLVVMESGATLGQSNKTFKNIFYSNEIFKLIKNLTIPSKFSEFILEANLIALGSLK